MVAAGKEVGIVSDSEGKMGLDLGKRDESRILQVFIYHQSLWVRCTFPKDVAKKSPDFPVRRSTQSCKRIQRGLREDS